jgi:hypothetical protein
MVRGKNVRLLTIINHLRLLRLENPTFSTASVKRRRGGHARRRSLSAIDPTATVLLQRRE